MNYTFEQLPQAVGQLFAKLDRIENLLLSKGSDQVQEPDDLLTIKEASELLKLSVPTIYGLVSNSKIPHSKPGKRLYFSRQELMEWIREGRRKTQSEIEAEADYYLTRKHR